MADQVYSLAINGFCANQFYSNILHYRFDDALFATREAAASALCNAWDTAYRTTYRACIPASSRLVSLKARCVDAPGGFESFLPLTGVLTGSRPGTLAASGVSPLIKKFVQNVPKHVGKVFLPGVTDSDLVDGVYSGAFVTAINANLGWVQGTLTLVGGGAPTAHPCLWDAKDRNYYLIQTAMLQSYPGTQRRRQLPV